MSGPSGDTVVILRPWCAVEVEVTPLHRMQVAMFTARQAVAPDQARLLVEDAMRFDLGWYIHATGFVPVGQPAVEITRTADITLDERDPTSVSMQAGAVEYVIRQRAMQAGELWHSICRALVEQEQNDGT